MVSVYTEHPRSTHGAVPQELYQCNRVIQVGVFISTSQMRKESAQVKEAEQGLG